jgi:hypothetical protein
MGGRPAPGRSARPQGGTDLRHLPRGAEPVNLLRLGEATRLDERESKTE